MPSALDEASAHVPRFVWRVISTRTRPDDDVQEWDPDLDTKEAFRSFISAHLKWDEYHAPCPLISFTGSLLWALNYAHWLLRQGDGDIRLFRIDAWRIPVGRIYPASSLAAYLEIAPRGILWHDDPYHEYLGLGFPPHEALLGCINISLVTGEEVNTLLPLFNLVDPNEGLLSSLRQFQVSWNPHQIFIPVKGITNKDVSAAVVLARKILQQYPQSEDTHFQITMVFLALQKRDWYNREAYDAIHRELPGTRLRSRLHSF